MNQALSGMRVADFSHVMAGPFASHLLRLMGAEVIKIESPKGDNFRSYGPDRRYDGMSPAFIAVNAGKKSIVLDLKDSEDLATARAILAQSDVLIENFRPGVMARLGLGYEEAKALAPGIIYCSVSGYGQDGPMRDWPAIDNIVQATSGMMSLGGSPDDPPSRVGFPVVDTLTGQTAALAILGALMKRGRTGEGERLDIAMFDASLAFMTSAVVPFLVTGKPLQRTGNTGYSGLPTSGAFVAGDGRLMALGVVQPNQFAALARHLGREDWLSDPRYATPDAQRANAAALQGELTDAFVSKGAAEWEAELSAAGIPCGMVRDVGEAASLPHLAARGAILPLQIPGLPDGDDVAIVSAGFARGGGNLPPPPRLDEHRNEILNWLKESIS